MKELEKILANGKLNIKTQLTDGDDIQLRAYYTDPLTQKRYWCKFTRAMGWEHLTISGQNKVPDWNVMCKVKDIFWDDEECCIEYHPRKSQYVNNNETCLHIWKPIGVELPEPPTILLGFQDISSGETSRVIHSVVENMSEEEKFQMAKKLGINVGNRSMKRKAGMK